MVDEPTCNSGPDADAKNNHAQILLCGVLEKPYRGGLEGHAGVIGIGSPENVSGGAQLSRVGGSLHAYEPGNGTITFRSYELGLEGVVGQHREMSLSGQFTTTVDQVATAFTSPINLPDQNVYESAIKTALSQ